MGILKSKNETIETLKSTSSKQKQRIEKMEIELKSLQERVKELETKKEKGCTDSLYGMKGKCVLNIVPKKSSQQTFQMDPKCKIKRGGGKDK